MGPSPDPPHLLQENYHHHSEHDGRPDLQSWISEGDEDILPVRRVENEDGTETLTYRYAEPVAGYEQLFGRVLIQHLP